ncbi:MAG TPA: hypothetical protein PK358_10430 [Spirochaetota bacterium]|nr:hypothetical protein [Spirochaetota bacterium]HPJ35242.1 hypothetical protein [Spirochaetota bacterium]
MLGLEGFGVFLAYIMSIVAGIACVVYGLKNWNIPPAAEVDSEINEEIEWEKNDPENEERD